MTQARLRFAPDILRRLGEELNPNVDQGILELVKNAYDADALNCVVEVENTLFSGGTVIVRDNGDGMDVEEIVDGWLVLGRSTKVLSKYSKRLGRSLAGNKGLGRLAAMRMGSRVILRTWPRDPEIGQALKEHKLVIEWDTFDSATAVDEVELAIDTIELDNSVPSGTEITITNLDHALGRNEVRRLARGLLLLADPFTDDSTGFQPELIASEFKDLEKLVKRRYFEEAEFHLRATVDAEGYADALVTDWKGNKLFSADHKLIAARRNSGPYKCPPSSFDLWIFILNKQTFSARSTTVAEVKEWLSEFGGVHLYVRGIRVAPYGNPGYDWLDMNLGRARNPEFRPSTNTSIGRIVTFDERNELLQKTDRSGLVENNVFFELKSFASDAIEWMARRRLEERDKRRNVQRSEAPQKVEQARKTITEAIKELPPIAQNQVRHSFEQYDKAREREAELLRREVQLYRTLSTAGITASTFAHESTQPVTLITRNAKQLDRYFQRELGQNYSSVQGPIERILRQAEMLQAFSNLVLSFVDHEKRRSGRIDVHAVIQDIEGAFKLLTTDRNVDLVLELDKEKPYLRGSYAALESVLINLVVNSLKAFEESVTTGQRTIVIRTIILQEQVVIKVLDNGPGIRGIEVKDVWLPGETTYPNGTGLGLAIVRDTVHDLGGKVAALATGQLGGAEVTIELPTIGA